MYLINAETEELLHIITPRFDTRYAILSHTWEDDEISFKDVSNGTNFREKKGYFKFKQTCLQAKRDRLEYVWIDTCCIDKDSSAELSEAINSMYKWYQQADVCYAYLSDMSDSLRTAGKVHAQSGASDKAVDPAEKFTSSRWFTRGWTLQELIAPKHVRFYSESWTIIGTKHQLAPAISNRTRIPEYVLQNSRPGICSSYSVAQRMSWAAFRFCTRKEDRAYSLLGIFDINMPLLYGEGNKAFTRLQFEIIKVSADHSIFAWTTTEETDRTRLLAPSPDSFAADGGRIISANKASYPGQSYEMTNAGLQITLPVYEDCSPVSGTYAVLNCKFNDDFRGQLALVIDQVPGESVKIGTCHDVVSGFLHASPGYRVVILDIGHCNEATPRTIMINRGINDEEHNSNTSDSFGQCVTRIWIPALSAEDRVFEVIHAYPNKQWNTDSGVLVLPKSLSGKGNSWAYVQMRAREISASFIFAVGSLNDRDIRFGRLLPLEKTRNANLAIIERLLFEAHVNSDYDSDSESEITHLTLDLGNDHTVHARLVSECYLDDPVVTVDVRLVPSNSAVDFLKSPQAHGQRSNPSDKKQNIRSAIWHPPGSQKLRPVPPTR